MEELAELKKELVRKDAEISELKSMLDGKIEARTPLPVVQSSSNFIPELTKIDKLDNKSIARYSRQLILPELGVQGQILLKNTSVLIVGCGGLGCPAAVYLAAAGIGCIGLVDYDHVELSNLHRQILHTEGRLGQHKSSSAAQACTQLNSSVQCIPYHVTLDSQSAIAIIKNYEIVVDATDNVATRYLLNDACVLANKPLVSGSALRFEGQLTVYNSNGGPCYRCLYPKPPPPETVTNCSDGGVLGVVPGIIGSLQALEAIKIAAKMGTTYAQKLLLYDALDGTFNVINLRTKQPKCVVCGTNPSITKLIDYEEFCGARASDKDKIQNILKPNERISVKDYKQIVDTDQKHILVDVRQPVELDICKLTWAVNLPLNDMQFKEQDISDFKKKIKDQQDKDKDITPIFLICRRGNDSQIGVRKLQNKLSDLPIILKDITGGLTAWAKSIDEDFPIY